MRTDDRTVCKVAQKREECLSGPEMARRDVHARRKYAPESASRSERGIWDAVSAKDRKKESTSHSDAGFRVALSQAASKRKTHPTLKPNSGTQFRRALDKKKDPFAEVLVNSRWRGRESRPRAARTDRCGAAPLRAALANAYAFTQLRALTGFDSMWGLHKRKGPLCRGPSQFKVAGKGIEPLTRGFSVLCSTN